MNHVFRIIWSRALGAWVVVSELAKSRSAARCTLRRVVVPSLLAMACAQVHATDVWWDGGSVDGGDPAANANGGAGIWNATLSNFDNALTGGADVAWINGDHRALFPSNGTYTITLGSGITAGDLTTLGGSVTLSGNTLTLIGTPVIDGTGTLVIGSALDGNDGLTKSGVGTVDLSGAKTLTGSIEVIGGTLQISGSAWAGAGPGAVFVRNGGTLNLAVAGAIGTDTSASRLVLDNGGRINAIGGAVQEYDTTLTGGAAAISSNGSWNGTWVLVAPTTLMLHGGVYGGDFADTGHNTLSVTTGAGGAILSGNNTYSGPTTVSTLLRLAGPNALSPNTNVTLAGAAAGDGVIELASDDLAIALGTGAGELRFNNTGGFRSVGGDRTVTLNGGAGLTWGSGGFVPAGNAFYLATDGASTLTFTNAIDLGGASRTIALGNGTGASHAVLSGVLSGAGGGLNLTRQTGNGVLGLAAANTYTGQTRVGAQVNLILDNANALPGGNAATGGTSNLALDGGVVLLTPASGDFERGTGTGGSQVQWITGGGFAALGGDRMVDIGGAGGTVTWGAASFVPNGGALTLGSTLADSMLTFANPIALGGATRDIVIANGGATVDATLSGAIVDGGTLVVDGHYAGSANKDTMLVAGTVRGAGTIDLAAGDDTLTLLDGGNVTALIDGGAGDDTIDAQVQAGTLVLAPTANFEALSKNGGGTLSLQGIASLRHGATQRRNARRRSGQHVDQRQHLRPRRRDTRCPRQLRGHRWRRQTHRVGHRARRT